jgi:hypothetical protein
MRVGSQVELPINALYGFITAASIFVVEEPDRPRSRARDTVSGVCVMAFKLRVELLGHEQDVRGCCTTPDGTIATCSRDKTVRLFSMVS